MPSRMQVPPNCDLTLGMTCVDKSAPGRTTWRMKADERFANPAGIMQGGFLGAFADSAMGAAARKLIFTSALTQNTRRSSTKVTAAAPMAESANAPRKPPCMIPAGLAKRSSAFMRQVVRPGTDLSTQVIPSVRSQLGGTCMREVTSGESNGTVPELTR